jgi:hypothetical protein
MYGRSGFRVLLAVLIALGAVALGAGAYQAGIAAGAAQAVTPGSGPMVVPYYGHPFGFGFGFFGFLGTLLFIFLIFAVVRAFAFAGGRGRGWGGPGRWGGWSGGPGGPGGAGPDGWRGSPWEARAHEVFDEWHRDAHSAGPATAAGDTAEPRKPGQTGQA